MVLVSDHVPRTSRKLLRGSADGPPQSGRDYHIVQVDKGISQVKLTKAILHGLWNVTGALQSPYGILKNSYTPMLPTVKAVYCWDPLAILTCQKPNFKSIVEKNQAPTMDSMVSCIWGRGKASFFGLVI